MGLAQEKLLARCIATAQRRLSQVLSDAIDSLPQRAGSAGGYLDSPQGSSSAALVAAQASAWRGEIIETFQHQFAATWCGRNAGTVTSPDSSSRTFGTFDRAVLRLIDKSPSDEDLLIGRLAQSTRNRFDDETCFGLEVRLGNLCNTRRLEGAANPIGPEAVFGALARACATASSEPELRAVLCQALHKPIAAALIDLYKEVNAFLKEHGVLPGLRYGVSNAKDEQRHTPTAEPANSAIDEAFQVIHRKRATKRNDSDTPALRRLTNALLDAERRANQGSVDLAAIAITVLKGPSAAITLGAGLLGDAQSALYRQVIALPVAAQVIEALTVSQGTVPTNRQCQPRLMTADELIRPLERVDAIHRHPIDILTSKLVASAFAHIMGDPELPAHLKDELARLQVVTMKAVLLDRTFFARAAHPLRRMMSTVAKRSLDPELDTGPDGPFDRILHNTVEYLLNNFETDLLIFEIALERFSDEIRQHNLPNAQVINELAQSLVAGEFIEAAREDAFEQLAIRITQAGRIPHYIHSFLQSVWVGLMADADVNGLPDEDSYVARLEVAEQLIWSVTPRRPDEMPRLVALLSGLIGALRRGMRAAGLPGAEEKRFLIALLATHARQLQSERLAEDGEFDKLPRRTAGNARDGKHARVPGRTQRAEQVPNTNPASVIPFTRMKLEEIVEFREPNKVVRRKLVWISPRKTLYIFCSEQAGQKPMSAAELADAMQQGLVACVQHKDTIIERAVAAATGPLKAA